MTHQKYNGFTLIELIIALSIISILSAYAIPSYQTFKQNQTMTQELNRLSSSINFARNQSILMGHHVILCATETYSSCDGSSQWSTGWMVFADKNRNRNYDPSDTMLLNENKMDNALNAISSIHRQKIRFNSTGFAPGTNLTIRFCDERGTESGKAIVVSNVGRPRVLQNINSCG